MSISDPLSDEELAATFTVDEVKGIRRAVVEDPSDHRPNDAIPYSYTPSWRRAILRLCNTVLEMAEDGVDVELGSVSVNFQANVDREQLESQSESIADELERVADEMRNNPPPAPPAMTRLMQVHSFCHALADENRRLREEVERLRNQPRNDEGNDQ